MISGLKEILAMRGGKSVTIDKEDKNRYRLVCLEEDRTKTAYYFGTPVYNAQTMQSIETKFLKEKDKISYMGTNSKIAITKNIRFENAEGFCKVEFPKPLTYVSDYELHYEKDILVPTVNGIAYRAKYNNMTPFVFEIESDRPFLEIRSNDKYFSIMRETFRPFVTVSCIGTTDADGMVIAPARIHFEKINDRKYKIVLSPCSIKGEYIFFEINLYEPKLVQDTTVESNNPTVNNVFGGTAFIGNSEEFGEQWLYSRPEFSKFSDIYDKKINRVILHLPKFSNGNIPLAAFRVSSRFCSFGSNWNNKISLAETVGDTIHDDNYYSMDVTSLFVDEKSKHIVRSEGIILKPKFKGSGFNVISTGDSCYAPQIFEINFE